MHVTDGPTQYNMHLYMLLANKPIQYIYASDALYFYCVRHEINNSLQIHTIGLGLAHRSDICLHYYGICVISTTIWEYKLNINNYYLFLLSSRPL